MDSRAIVSAWDAGEGEGPIERALVLLGTGLPHLTREELEALTVGEMDALLLELRERTLGPVLRCRSSCPRCAAGLEFAAEVGVLRAGTSLPVGDLFLDAAGWAVRFQVPGVRDLQFAARAPGEAAARAALVERCVLECLRGGEPAPAAELPEELVARLAGAMADADPQGDAQLQLDCPACGHTFEQQLDIAAFFWAELAAEARRLLREVDTLARAYGWSEAETLKLSQRRRQRYLEMVGA